jgi:uncharacterized membrane protein
MKITIKREIWNVLIVALPFIYFIMIWENLPQVVPMHWNIDGKADRFGDKAGLWMIPVALPFLTYVIFLVAPVFTGKGQLNKMGLKYDRLKFSLVLMTSVLASYILFVVKEQTIYLPSILPGLVGLLFAVFGNYFPVLKRNLYIGIKTPWTLKSDIVWEKTHRMAGKYWFIGGILVVICSLLFEHAVAIKILLVVAAVITVIPVAFSYFEYRKVSKSNGL